jgi:hypothetical protein
VVQVFLLWLGLIKIRIVLTRSIIMLRREKCI